MRAFFARLKIAFQVVLALLAAVWLLNFLDSPFFESRLDRVIERAPFIADVETAVKAVGILFILVWGLFFIDGLLFGNNLKRHYGVRPRQSPNPARFVTSTLLHGNYQHLRNNTRHLLFFSGMVLLMLGDVQAFVLATIVMIVIGGAGIWLFGTKESNHIGASGLVLGYFGFVLAYGFFVASGIWAVVAVVVALLFGRHVFRTLRLQAPGISFAGHLWGFIGGLVAAYALWSLLPQ